MGTIFFSCTILGFILFIVLTVRDNKKEKIIQIEKIKKDEEYRAQKAKIEAERQALLDTYTKGPENLFHKISNEPILYQIEDLPIDFEDREYTAFDFETANSSALSAISLGIAHFKGNTLLDVIEFRFPPIFDDTNDDDEYRFTYLHGIKPSDVKDLPTITEIWDEIEPHLNQKHLIAHNADFDINVLKETLTYLNKRLNNNRISCTYKLSKRFMRYEDSYKLENLCKEYEIPYWNHKAAFDAVSAGILFMTCLAESPGGAITDSAMNGARIALKPIKNTN